MGDKCKKCGKETARFLDDKKEWVGHCLKCQGETIQLPLETFTKKMLLLKDDGECCFLANHKDFNSPGVYSWGHEYMQKHGLTKEDFERQAIEDYNIKDLRWIN